MVFGFFSLQIVMSSSARFKNKEARLTYPHLGSLIDANPGHVKPPTIKKRMTGVLIYEPNNVLLPYKFKMMAALKDVNALAYQSVNDAGFQLSGADRTKKWPCLSAWNREVPDASLPFSIFAGVDLGKLLAAVNTETIRNG